MKGVDISHYQKGLTIRQIREAGNDFAIIKATEGTTLFDENFNDNFHWARENGLVRGAYHF